MPKFLGSKLFWLVSLIANTLCLQESRSQTFELLHSFEGADGSQPSCTLLQGTDGNLYGTTRAGGFEQNGTIFRISGGTFTTIALFGLTNGSHPHAGLTEGRDGNFYGTTAWGGTNDYGNYGTVFRTTTNGVITSLATFDSDNGGEPHCRLVQGKDDFLYGTTYRGGLGYGTVFKISTNGSLTTVAPFNGFTDVYAGLIQAHDGYFYGTALGGGANGAGAVFRMTTNGVITEFFSFGNTNGFGPVAELMQASDGSFYGTTINGGTNQDPMFFRDIGTAFKLTTNGVQSFFVTFSNGDNDYQFPYAGFVEATDGFFYSVAGGGEFGAGAVYKMSPDGDVTTVFSFDGSNGNNPMASLMQGRDGCLYGTTMNGGAYDLGTVFRIVPVALSSALSGTQLILSWPTNAMGFTLQFSSGLTSPTNWIDFTNTPPVVGGQFTITNTVSGSGQFYRLKK